GKAGPWALEGRARLTLRDRNTVKMVAEHWGCSPDHVRNLIASGTLDAIKLGGVIRITRAHIEECERACSTKATADQAKAQGQAARMARNLERAVRTAR